MKKIAALARTWLVLDFFGDARRAGKGHGSSLTTTIFAQSFLALVFATLLYPDVPPVPFAAANLCLSTLLVAIGALGDEARPNRRAADEVLVATAPMSAFAAVLARAGHAAFHVMLVTIGMALPPAILLAHLTHTNWSVPGYVLAACACSGLATGALGVITRAVAVWSGPARAALLQGTLKAVALGGGLVAFALGLRRLQGTAEQLPIGRFGVELLPPYHAARWLQAPATEAWRLLPFVGGGIVLLGLATLLARTSRPGRERIGRGGLCGRLLHRIGGTGARLGVAEFVAVSIWRSPGFRARVLPLLGMPAGMAALLASEPQRSGFVLVGLLLQLPAIYLPFLIAFLPRADQPGTGWVFAQSPGITTALVQDATWRALVTHVLLPVHTLALGLVLLATGGNVDVVATSAFAFGVAVLAARAMVRPLQQVPFTVGDEADASADLGSAFAAALVLGGLGSGLALLPWWPVRWLVAALVLAMAVDRLRRTPVAEAGTDGALLAEPGPVRAAKPAEAAAPETGPPAPNPSLERELRAVAVLYAAIGLLPWWIGSAFAP
ncbi:MAG: hypothetical protein U1F60_11480 [Planctomycetota bacterium]